MADMEAKIAEIIQRIEVASHRDEREEIEECKDEILALIAADREPLVEALDLAKKQILHMEECFQPNERLGTTEKALAKIDKALEVGKCQETK